MRTVRVDDSGNLYDPDPLYVHGWEPDSEIHWFEFKRAIVPGLVAFAVGLVLVAAVWLLLSGKP